MTHKMKACTFGRSPTLFSQRMATLIGLLTSLTISMTTKTVPLFGSDMGLSHGNDEVCNRTDLCPRLHL